MNFRGLLLGYQPSEILSTQHSSNKQNIVIFLTGFVLFIDWNFAFGDGRRPRSAARGVGWTDPDCVHAVLARGGNFDRSGALLLDAAQAILLAHCHGEGLSPSHMMYLFYLSQDTTVRIYPFMLAHRRSKKYHMITCIKFYQSAVLGGGGMTLEKHLVP